MADESIDISRVMQSVREEVVMTTYTVTVAAGTLLLIGNMARNLHLGNPLSIPHSALYLVFLTIYTFRRRIGARWLALLMLLMLYLAATFGYFIYGFIGNSAPVYMAFCIVASSFYGPRAGVVAAGASVVMMVAAAVMALSGRLTLSFDMQAFISSPASWFAAIATFGAMGGIALAQSGLMHRNLESLLRDQQVRMRDLSQANLRLEREIAARSEVEDELRRQSALLENILGSLPQGIGVFDEQLRLLVWNQGMIDALELPGVVKNASFEDLVRVPGLRDRAGDAGERIAMHRARTMRFEPHAFEWPHADGRTHLVVGTPFTAGGRIVGFITTYTDITERKDREQELLKVEKLKSLGVLAGGIAHDFNNILTAITGNLSLAQMQIDAGHRAHHPLTEAEKASERAAELAHQLLTFARGGEPVKKVISLRRLVNESVSLVLHGSTVKGAVDVPDGIHAVEADEGQLSQVFHNIIINARQAMPDGGVLTVAARNETLDADNTWSLPPGAYVRLAFADQGCGIPEGDLKRIFDPYFTTKEAGTGLGLASAHSIVSRHGGHISVSSAEGKGSTFTVLLPSTGREQAPSRTEPDALTAGDHAGGHILVMDDEKMILDMAVTVLHHLGYQVTTCQNGAEAIANYAAGREAGKPFAAVIMDLTIPGGMGGKEAAQQICAIDPKACLIVSSGYSHDPILSDFASFGFAGAVAKPYTARELGRLLSSLLTERRAEGREQH